MDVSQYLEIFIDESNEHLQNLSDGIMILEKEPDNSDTINEIFRAAHSLKGMAGTMGYKRMQNLTHDMENVFSEVRNGNIKVDSRMVDVLFQCLDALEQYVNNIQETSDEGTDDNEPIIKALNSFIVNNEDKGILPEEAKKEDVPAEEKKEENVEAGDGSYAKYNNMVFADFEKNAVNEALEKKMNVFVIKVSVDENCILKAARAFLVFKNLEGHCDIIKSEPSAQDIEDEKFELDFSIVVVTEESYESIIGIIKNVSEIKDAAGEAITTPFAEDDEKEEVKEEPKHEENKNQSETKPAAASDDNGVFNFEGGCYAKVIDLDKDSEPDIYNAIRRDALLENVTVDANGKIDFADKSVTENTRVSYPIDHIKNIVRPISSAPAAKNVIFLSADAFGVLPPVSILTPEQTQYYFLSGFTAKLAGTERGITEPTPTFSACFGQAFLELHPTKYAEELVKKMQKSGAKAYLVNTGWNGTGKRISIKDTRGIIDAILSGAINEVPTKKIPMFNFEVPTELPGVDTGILDPRDTYADASEWETKAKDLADRFVKNFAKYEGNAAGKALVAAGPQA